MMSTVVLAAGGWTAEAADPAPPFAPGKPPLNLPQGVSPGFPQGFAAKERAPSKATISLNCDKVITLSTGSGKGTCSINPADGSGRCDDSNGNSASASCQSCKRTSGSGSCLIN
jgi:hypothetical protein